ncbi:hypothetical protein [Flavobacterium degerlachei]|jgi:hypothetical protein|uniref:YD repeat-containing protein n=1 Tax=Flavobacterium degerlachei TaxID=229203 RepID=A0A1H2WNU9_9FLAO|nr:hypothetical protein [Flavobacterium degerlachei]SDW82343.1 hypothetical protein SAMN05444338_10517 [Flavobacterium degerlachei]
MKKRLNIVLILCSVLAVFCSCSKDKDENMKFLKQLVETSADGTSTTTDFTYNGEEIKSIDGVKQHTDFSYMDGLITKIVVLDKTNKTVNTIEYNYLRGKLVSAKSSDNYIIKYTANSDNSIAYERFDINAEDKEVKIYHGTLYFEKNNFIKDQRTFDNAPSGVSITYTASFEYDAKSNPFHSIMGYEKLLDHNDIISANNSLISVITNSSSQNDQVISSANFYKSTFKYDEDGYPTEKISEAVMPVNGNSEYKKSEYFY